MKNNEVTHLTITMNQEKLISSIEEEQIAKFVFDTNLHSKFMSYGSNQYSKSNIEKLKKYVKNKYENLYCDLFYTGLFFLSFNKLVNVNLIIDIADRYTMIVPVTKKNIDDLIALINTFNVNLQWLSPEEFNQMMQNLTDNPFGFEDMVSLRFSYMLVMAGALAVREYKRANKWEMN